MAFSFLFFFFLFFFAAPAGAETGIVYGRGHAFLLDAPDGWVLDSRSGNGQGLPVVFYPRTASWRTADAVMYANTSVKEEGARGRWRS